MGGEFIPAKGRKPTRIMLTHGPWTLRLAVIVVQRGNAPVTLTRCSAEVLGRGDLRFTVHPRGLLGGFARIIGLGGIELRNPMLRDAVVARTNHPSRVRSLLNDPAVSGPLLGATRTQLRYRRVSWWRRRRAGKDARAVTADMDGRVQDPEQLVEMVELTKAVIDRLVGMGAIDANRTPPLSP